MKSNQAASLSVAHAQSANFIRGFAQRLNRNLVSYITVCQIEFIETYCAGAMSLFCACADCQYQKITAVLWVPALKRDYTC
jgi:hypothetical protein